MKKGQVYEATVERVDFPNKGIARVGDEAVVVKNSLPGQKIKLSVNKIRNGRAEGRLLEVLERSPLESGCPCSLFGVCGGCTYLSLPYEEQLRIKEGQVRRLLDSCLNRQEFPWKWEGIKGSPVVYEYRNKMEFSFGDERKDGPLTLGMHKRGSFYDVVTVDCCRIVDGDYRLILKTAQEYFSGGYLLYGGFSEELSKEEDEGTGDSGVGIRYFHRLRHEGYLRHLVLRKASRTGEILAALVTTSQDPWGRREADVRQPAEAGAEPDSGQRSGAEPHSFAMSEKQLLAGFLASFLELERSGRLQGHFAGILHVVNDSPADVVRSDRTETLFGRDFFYEELLGLRFKVSVFSFFQTNTYGAEVLYETVRDYVGTLRDGAGVQDKVVFDLYSGTGTIAQLMASVTRRVIGVEIVEEAVEAAKRNAKENGLKNCEFLVGDVLKVLDTIADKPDFIILDPPRDGVHPKALQKIADRIRVKNILYISCKPTSLVRDLEQFMGYGYVVTRACSVDMFPHTANIETVCRLELRE